MIKKYHKLLITIMIITNMVCFINSFIKTDRACYLFHTPFTNNDGYERV